MSDTPTPAPARELKFPHAKNIPIVTIVELREAFLRELYGILNSPWSKREAEVGREVRIVDMISRHYEDCKNTPEGIRMADIITEIEYLAKENGWQTKPSLKVMYFTPIGRKI